MQDDLGRSVAAELGPDAAYVRCDVTDEVQIAAAVDLAVERHGHLDVLYSNAGISGSVTQTAVGALDLADFDRTMAANARSAVARIKHAARVMVPRRSGCIICTASPAGVLGGGTPADCSEIRWLRYTAYLYFGEAINSKPLEALLLNRSTTLGPFVKNKSDYVKKALAKETWEKIFLWPNGTATGKLVLSRTAE